MDRYLLHVNLRHSHQRAAAGATENAGVYTCSVVLVTINALLLFKYQQLCYVKIVISVLLLFIRVYRHKHSVVLPRDARSASAVLLS